MIKSSFLYSIIFVFCITSSANSAGVCLPEGFTYTDGDPEYSKGLQCMGSDPEIFFLLTEDSGVITEIIFTNEAIIHKICQPYKGLDFLNFGDYSLNRSTLILFKNQKQVGNCNILSADALRKVAQKYLASRLSKNKI